MIGKITPIFNFCSKFNREEFIGSNICFIKCSDEIVALAFLHSCCNSRGVRIFCCRSILIQYYCEFDCIFRCCDRNKVHVTGLGNTCTGNEVFDCIACKNNRESFVSVCNSPCGISCSRSNCSVLVSIRNPYILYADFCCGVFRECVLEGKFSHVKAYVRM